MEDLPLYTHVLQEWQSGHTPYNDSMSPYFFLYPPVFLYVAGFLARLLPIHWGPFLFVTVHYLATLALPLVLARYFFRQAWLGPLLAMLIFLAAPRFSGVAALSGGNIASIVDCMVFIAAVPGLRRGFWGWFYVAVFVGALIKITFVAMLLLPLLVGRRQWVRCILCGIVVVMSNQIERFSLPELYNGYEWSLQQGILGQRIFGFGIFGVLASYEFKRDHAVGLLPYIISIGFSISLVLLMFILRHRLESFPVDGNPSELALNGNWLALVITSIVLINPRVMQYDSDVALFACFVLLVHGLKIRRVLMLFWALFLPSLFVPFVVSNAHLHGMYDSIIMLSAFALGYWRLWRESPAKHKDAKPVSTQLKPAIP